MITLYRTRPWLRHAAIGCVVSVCVFSITAEAKTTPSAGSSSQSSRISTEALLASPFAHAFQTKDYAAALKALDAPAHTYPDDPVLLRYRALVLTRLGRTKERLRFIDSSWRAIRSMCRPICSWAKRTGKRAITKRRLGSGAGGSSTATLRHTADGPKQSSIGCA